MDILSLILGALGGVGGFLLGGPAGAVPGFSIGSALGAGISGGDGSSDPGKSSDQEYMRMLARQIGQNPITGASGQYEHLAGSLASRGILNSGAAGSAFGGLEAALMGQRTQNQISAAGILGGIGQTPQSQWGQAGQAVGQSAPLLIQALLGQQTNKPVIPSSTPANMQSTSFNPYSNQNHNTDLLAYLGYGRKN